MYYPFLTGYAVLAIVVHVLIWVLAITLIIWIIRALSGHRHGQNGRGRFSLMTDNSHTILRERFARGEITKEQFDMMKKDLDHS